MRAPHRLSRRGQRGQSVVEYAVIAATLLVALLAVSQGVTGGMNAGLDRAATGFSEDAAPGR